ncbi:Glutaredoxin 2 [Aphelenchoides bicaudatus]|nr:Glutaredoxin 2 [Aphelenchoides bicaudatus]
MFENIYSFFEKYGWWALLAAGAFFLVYQKFLHDKIQTMYADRELMNQKKFDTDQQQLHRERMEKAREKMQAEYNKEAEHQKELERIKAQQRKNQKLGINEEELKANAPKPRFDALQFVNDQIAAKPVVIFSKSWCPYSRKAKQILIGTYRIDPQYYKVIELDEIDEKNASLIQDVLQRLTGGRSVPRVFIQGKFVGGGDDTEKYHRENQISPMLKAANVKFLE